MDGATPSIDCRNCTFDVQLEQDIAVAEVVGRVFDGNSSQIRIVDWFCPAGDSEFTPATLVVFDAAMQGVTSVAAKVMPFWRSWFHADEEMASSYNWRHRMHPGRAILANCGQIGNPAGKSPLTKLSQFFVSFCQC